MTLVASNDTERHQLNTDPIALTTLARTIRFARFNPAVFSSLARVVEAASLLAAGEVSARMAPVVADAALMPIIIALIASALFQKLGLYTVASFSAPQRNAAKLMFAWIVTLLAVYVGLRLLTNAPDLSHGWLAIWFVTGVAAIAAARGLLLLVTDTLRNGGHMTRNAII